LTSPAPSQLSGLLDAASAQRVSDALRRSSYTVEGVASLPVADPDGTSPLATLVTLFGRGEPLDVDRVAAVLPLHEAGPLLTRSGTTIRAAYDVTPHGDDSHDWWVVGDRTDAAGRPQRRDHVLGVGGASLTLAQLTVRRPVRRALDIGTGCGVQALHLAGHADAVTATDSVPRALRLAATTAALSGVTVELLEGDLVDPVERREFDLVVCNPPFVVGPAARFDYRDGGLAGDELSRRAVRAAASVLAEGGIAQLLVNWLHVGGEDWSERVSAWVSDLGVDAWLLERDVEEPAAYVTTWLDDAGESGDAGLRDQWLRWFAAERIDAVGFGWVVLRRGEAPHRVGVEPLLQPVDQPLGPHIAGWLDRTAWLRGRDDASLLAHAFRAAHGVWLDTAATVGAAGWEPVARMLRFDTGFRWTLPTDEATAALVAGCDGSRPLSDLVAVLSVATGVPTHELEPVVCSTVRGLVDRGVVLP
jgi:methylase of polypeptide subunit release factors